MVNMEDQGAGAAQGAAAGQAQAVHGQPDIHEILRNSITMKFEYRQTETMATNVQRFLDGQARKSNASITSNVYNALMDTLGRADEANVSFLDSALSTVAVTDALANQDYNAALKALRISLMELEPNKQLTLVGFANSLRGDLTAAGRNGDPQAIYTAMVTGLKSIKRGSQQPDNNTLRELYFSNLDENTKTIMIHAKMDHDKTEGSWQKFHQAVVETLKDLNVPQISRQKHVMLVEPQTEVAMLAKEFKSFRDELAKENQHERRGRERSRERSKERHEQNSSPVQKSIVSERERSRQRHRWCNQCPAGREERHLHLPKDCKYEIQGSRHPCVFPPIC